MSRQSIGIEISNDDNNVDGAKLEDTAGTGIDDYVQ